TGSARSSRSPPCGSSRGPATGFNLLANSSSVRHQISSEVGSGAHGAMTRRHMLTRGLQEQESRNTVLFLDPFSADVLLQRATGSPRRKTPQATATLPP
ncbi:hypothetical protein LEMLEM_LOCUS6240, partial [Lemmus lemmus]